MLKNLSPGIKISISRSITNSFEQYMNKIGWDEDKFSIDKFAAEWGEYITTQASWYEKVSDDLKADPAFHQELAVKINETINKLLSEEPTPEQMEEIEKLEKQAGKEYNYSSKLEAKYIINKLKAELH